MENWERERYYCVSLPSGLALPHVEVQVNPPSDLKNAFLFKNYFEDFLYQRGLFVTNQGNSELLSIEILVLFHHFLQQ